MSRNFLLALLALCLIAAGVDYLRVAERERSLQAAAADLLANWHPRYEPAIRRRLMREAAARELTLPEGTVRLSREPTQATPLAARALGSAARTFLVRIEAPYEAEWLWLRLSRTLSVQRAVTTDGADASPPADAQRAAGKPLPVFLD